MIEDDEDKLSKATSRAARAEDLLKNELLAEAFQKLEATYTAAWRSTHIDDAPAREKLFIAVNLVGKIRDHLHSVVSNGKLAAAELKEMTETAARQKRWEDVRG